MSSSLFLSSMFWTNGISSTHLLACLLLANGDAPFLLSGKTLALLRCCCWLDYITADVFVYDTTCRRLFAGTLIKLAAEICFIIRVFFAQYVVLLFPDIVSVSSFLFSTWKGRRTATDESTEEVYKSFCKKSDLKRSQDDEPETQCDCTDLNTSRFLSAVTREAKLELHAG